MGHTVGPTDARGGEIQNGKRHIGVNDEVFPANGGGVKKIKAWLPDGYSQIFISYVFSPCGFWTMAPLRYAAKLDPFLSLDCAPRPPPWRNPRKGRDQILLYGNLDSELRVPH